MQFDNIDRFVLFSEPKDELRLDCANFLIYLKLDAIATSWTLVS